MPELIAAMFILLIDEQRPNTRWHLPMSYWAIRLIDCIIDRFNRVAVYGKSSHISANDTWMINVLYNIYYIRHLSFKIHSFINELLSWILFIMLK